MIIVSRQVVRIFTGSFAIAITLWPFIFIRSRRHILNKTVINHEKIHLKQQLELLLIFFYLWYVLEYLFYRVKGHSKFDAYKNISFEKEAYAHETNENYLKERSCYAFLKYTSK